MSITKDTVKYVANLARIELSEKEQELFTSQLNDILSYIAKLNNVDTSKVEPMSHLPGASSIMRKDASSRPLDNSSALANAPDKDKGFFKVPRVIE